MARAVVTVEKSFVGGILHNIRLTDTYTVSLSAAPKVGDLYSVGKSSVSPSPYNARVLKVEPVSTGS